MAEASIVGPEHETLNTIQRTIDWYTAYDDETLSYLIAYARQRGINSVLELVGPPITESNGQVREKKQLSIEKLTGLENSTNEMTAFFREPNLAIAAETLRGHRSAKILFIGGSWKEVTSEILLLDEVGFSPSDIEIVVINNSPTETTNFSNGGANIGKADLQCLSPSTGLSLKYYLDNSGKKVFSQIPDEMELGNKDTSRLQLNPQWQPRIKHLSMDIQDVNSIQHLHQDLFDMVIANNVLLHYTPQEVSTIIAGIDPLIKPDGLLLTEKTHPRMRVQTDPPEPGTYSYWQYLTMVSRNGDLSLYESYMKNQLTAQFPDLKFMREHAENGKIYSKLKT